MIGDAIPREFSDPLLDTYHANYLEDGAAMPPESMQGHHGRRNVQCRKSSADALRAASRIKVSIS